MFIVVKFIPQLGEWLPLPLSFTTLEAAAAHASTLGAGYRAARNGGN